jgi:hypothetical protein
MLYVVSPVLQTDAEKNLEVRYCFHLLHPLNPSLINPHIIACSIIGVVESLFKEAINKLENCYMPAKLV